MKTIKLALSAEESRKYMTPMPEVESFRLLNANNAGVCFDRRFGTAGD